MDAFCGGAQVVRRSSLRALQLMDWRLFCLMARSPRGIRLSKAHCLAEGQTASLEIRSLPLPLMTSNLRWIYRNYDRTYYVEDGDWGFEEKAFSSPSHCQGDLCRKTNRFRATEQYKIMLAGIRSGNFEACYWCRSEADLPRYFANLIATFRSMKVEGYKTYAELGKTFPDEIHLLLDRDGKYIQSGGGTHRLSMARLLGIRRVPVMITKIHAQHLNMSAFAGLLMNILDRWASYPFHSVIWP